MEHDTKTQWYSDLNYRLFRHGFTPDTINWKIVRKAWKAKATIDEAVIMYLDYFFKEEAK